MKVNIVSERHNPYLKRKEVVADIEHGAESTPSKAAVQELIAKQLSADKEKVEVIDIMSEKGLAKSRSMIFIWEEAPKKKEKKAEAAPTEAQAAAPAEKKETKSEAEEEKPEEKK